MGKVKIHVLYCGGWGYEPKFEAIKVRDILTQWHLQWFEAHWNPDHCAIHANEYKFQAQISDEFSAEINDLEIVGEPTPETSGKLEVSLTVNYIY